MHCGMAECGSKNSGYFVAHMDFVPNTHDIILFFNAFAVGRSKDDAEKALEASVFKASWRSSNMKKKTSIC